MARGVNKVILVGNVGNDPQTATTTTGAAVCNFSLATSESWRDKDLKQQERTEWHKLTAFGKLAEIVIAYVQKGSKIYVEGQLRTRKWTDKEGRECYTTEIIVSELNLLGSGGGEKSHAPQSQPGAPDDGFDDSNILF